MTDFGNSSFRVFIPLCITSVLSADVTTIPNGRPSAAEEVDMTKSRLLKSSKDDGVSTKT